MAVRTVPSGCYLQPSNTESTDRNGLDGFTAEVKGSYSDLETWMRTFVIGTDTFDGHVIRSRNLRRVAGDLGVLAITMSDDDAAQSGDGGGTSAYKGVWSFKSARNDVSIMAYCGSAAQRVHIELWQKETSATIADADKYRDDDGTVHELTNAEKMIVDKIRLGRETVVRFYPVLTYTSYYRSCPQNWGVDVGLIRTPAAAADRVIAPANINSVISGFVWLKVQDDVEELPESGFKRVMSWWGIHENDGGWDQDFYGTNRWPMPLTSN